MTRFLLRRLASSVVVLAGVSVIVFALARLIPTDVAAMYIGPRARPDDIEQPRAASMRCLERALDLRDLRLECRRTESRCAIDQTDRLVSHTVKAANSRETDTSTMTATPIQISMVRSEVKPTEVYSRLSHSLLWSVSG